MIHFRQDDRLIRCRILQEIHRDKRRGGRIVAGDMRYRQRRNGRSILEDNSVSLKRIVRHRNRLFRRSHDDCPAFSGRLRLLLFMGFQFLMNENGRFLFFRRLINMDGNAVPACLSVYIDIEITGAGFIRLQETVHDPHGR